MTKCLLMRCFKKVLKNDDTAYYVMLLTRIYMLHQRKTWNWETETFLGEWRITQVWGLRIWITFESKERDRSYSQENLRTVFCVWETIFPALFILFTLLLALFIWFWQLRMTLSVFITWYVIIILTTKIIKIQHQRQTHKLVTTKYLK